MQLTAIIILATVNPWSKLQGVHTASRKEDLHIYYFITIALKNSNIDCESKIKLARYLLKNRLYNIRFLMI